MATTTPNLGLVKPDYEDLADIAVLNDNSDTIDSAVKAVQDGISQGAITAVLPADYTFTTTSYEQMPLRAYNTYGDAFTLSNNAITCNKSGYLLGMATVVASDMNDQSVLNCRILKGNTTIAQGATRTSGVYGQVDIVAVLFPVTAGDVITFTACNSSNGLGKVQSGNQRTHITLLMIATR